MHKARFAETLDDGQVRCTLCPHDCRIADGAHGACGVRINRSGELFTLVYDKIVARHVEPIEKKPLFHFMPGSLSYSIASVGCNLRCAFCQNWDISQWPKDHLPRKLEWKTDDQPPQVLCPQLESIERTMPGESVTPQQIVDAAIESGASTIAYTYTEPTIFFELAYDTAELARAQGLKNIFVTSGFISEQPLRELANVIDAANVDLKFFNDQSYRRISRVRLQPILDAIRLFHELGVWLEVTTLIIPGVNDSYDQLSHIARFICSVSPRIPWHISQFYPAWKMLDVPRTPLPTLHAARRIGLDAGLRYVYEGNVPGHGTESTYCPNCNKVLIDRYGYLVRSNRIRNGRCPDCGETIDGVGMDGPVKLESTA